MTEIPNRQLTQADVEEWYRVAEELKKLKSRESLLRSFIFKALFTDPKEGVNTAAIPGAGDEYVVKATHKINRDVDPAALGAMREEFAQAGISADDLVNWKPSLKTGEYRNLTAEQRHLFEQCLIIKPGTPTLEISKASATRKKA